MWPLTKQPAKRRERNLDVKPVRAKSAIVERKEEGGALVKMPIRGSWPFKLPAGTTKSYELDEMGLLVWDCCDGRTTIVRIIEKFAQRYRLNLRESEVATLSFLQTLARKQLIGMGDER